MIDSNSWIQKNCTIAPEAEILSSTLESEVFVDKYSQITNSSLGEKVRIERYNRILYSTLGRFTYTGANTAVINATVGNFDSISWNVSIGGNTHDMNRVTMHSFLVYPKWGMGGNSNWESAKEPCQLGNDIWVAAGVNILRGVTIGDGAIIGAGTIVTKDVPAYSIVVGNPGKVIKMRFSDQIIERMLQLKWWEFPTLVIRQNFDLFHSELNMDIIDQLFELKDQISTSES